MLIQIQDQEFTLMQNRIHMPLKTASWPQQDSKVLVDGSCFFGGTNAVDWRLLTVGEVKSSLSESDNFVTVWNGVDHRVADLLVDYWRSDAVAAERESQVEVLLAMPQDPVPPECLQKLTAGFGMLVRLPTQNDLICLNRTAFKDVSDTTTLLQLLVQIWSAAEDCSGQQRTCVLLCDQPGQEFPADRLPEPGPGRAQVSADVLQDAINTAVHGLSSAAKGRLTAMQEKCAQAGMLLLWDLLDASHDISQSMEGQGTPRTGDYWHGIMHRREPDAGNASYWFRRVGQHPAFASLASGLTAWMRYQSASAEEMAVVSRLLQKNGSWDPFAMIELSQQALRMPGSVEHRCCRRIQYFEMLNLLCWGVG